MKITKLTALVCCIAMLCICFASCDLIDTGNSTGELQTDRYVDTVTIKLATNDAKMKDVVLAAGAPITTVAVDGDNFMIDSEAKLNDASVNNGYVYIDGVIYHSKQVTVSDKSLSSYTKADMSADQRTELLSSIGPGASIGKNDFAFSEKTQNGNIENYTYTELLDDSKNSLCAIFAERFNLIGATVALGEVLYSEDYTDGRISGSVLSCSFVINMGGQDYEITMHTYHSYDYDAEVSIAAPADADKYNTVSLEEILK